jgi:hypothetical protein
MDKIKNGVELIAEERQRQIDQEGWTSERDDQYVDDDLAMAAASYAIPGRLRDIYSVEGIEAAYPMWPWDLEWWKPTPDNRIRELQKAGALIAAEIDRLKRKEVSNGKA